EWLGSPIVYIEPFEFASRLREISKTHHASTGCAYHYLHMARGNFREFLKGDEVWLKKYLYVLRPILAVLWIEKGLGVVPTEFQKLVDGTLEDPVLLSAIEGLLIRKKQGDEMKRGPKVPEISEFIERELTRLGESSFNFESNPAPVEMLNDLFRGTLWEVWG
ncbi:MAG: nucleotidyltransferase domain-containing protein, partial [Candidatus Omnitrophica bacterium]|nr:nucleotidyltransferase domain-containing protein [Candidatus Omnitrophota bacterium]